jgi:hypothetical protein
MAKSLLTARRPRCAVLSEPLNTIARVTRGSLPTSDFVQVSPR